MKVKFRWEVTKISRSTTPELNMFMVVGKSVWQQKIRSPHWQRPNTEPAK
jgi:hypothetical protein